jgi:hypothetical protein
MFNKPLELGWRARRADVVLAYALYVPTGRASPGGSDGVGRGYLTHEPSLGGTLYFDAQRTWRLSALGSYDVNGKMRDVDVTRGATVHVQGGFGKTLFKVLDVGVVGYALWQIEDDTGADLPPKIRGARDRVYGLGPEIDLTIPQIRGRLTARYEHDFAVESRPVGQILLFGLTVALWKPARPPPRE